jgi:ComF family protein
MAEGLEGQYSCINYVPLHEKRRKHRGYDQAQLLAKEVAKITRVPFREALVRTRNTKTQTKLDAMQRQTNISGAFEAIERVTGRVVLVDDVLTTGATAAECARVLMENGADEVVILAFARATGEKQAKKPWFIGRFFAIL